MMMPLTSEIKRLTDTQDMPSIFSKAARRLDAVLSLGEVSESQRGGERELWLWNGIVWLSAS